MNVHCQFCQHNFNLTRDYIEMAVKEAQEERQKYHAVECVNCRKTIKIPIKQMKRYLPRQKRS